MQQSPLFVHVFASFGRGGVPLRIAGFLNWLGAEARHLILALDGDFSAEEALDGKADVRVEAVNLKGNFLARLGQIRKRLAEEETDLLLTYNWGAIEWALANRLNPLCPHIHFESGFGKEEARAQLRRRVLVRRLALAKTSAIVVPSATLAELAEKQWAQPKSRICQIANGVDVERFNVSPDRSLITGLREGGQNRVVGTVAPLRPEKNLSRLIRAFGHASLVMPDARLVIVGDGADRATLEACVSALELNDKVIFAGHISAPEKILGLFNIFAMSSDTEQMPNAVLQAMAAGLPVVATDVGDIRRMVAEENREMIVAADDDALAAALHRALSNSEHSGKVGRLNKDRAIETFAVNKMYMAYQELIAGLIV